MRTVVAVLSIILSIAVVVLAVLQISGVWETSANLFVPLLGLTNLCRRICSGIQTERPHISA